MKIFDYNSMHRHLNRGHTLSSIKYALKHQKLTHVNIGWRRKMKNNNDKVIIKY